LSRLVLDALLVEVARERGAEVREGYSVSDVLRRDGQVVGVVGASGEQLGAHLVVGADGVNSGVARSVGARKRVRWPRRLGLVRSLPVGRFGPSLRAFEAALADYPEVVARLRHGKLVGSIQGVGPLARRVRTVAGQGYALVGDAAGFFDPFTGEGIFRALRAAELLTSSQDEYAAGRKRAFSAKQRLVALVGVIVQTPRLMDFTLRRLRARPMAARELGCVLGDLEPARGGLVWQLFGP
jgi:flavin-dependent dehydrogenase